MNKQPSDFRCRLYVIVNALCTWWVYHTLPTPVGQGGVILDIVGFVMAVIVFGIATLGILG